MPSDEIKTNKFDHYTGAGAADGFRERIRAIEKGYDLDHDYREHSAEDLMRASACYSDMAASTLGEAKMDFPHPFWPEQELGPQKDLTGEPYEAGIRAFSYLCAALDFMNLLAGEATATQE